MGHLRCVLFDMNGTLLDPAGVGEPLGLGPEESHASLRDGCLQSMAETLAGTSRPFADYLRAALRRRAVLAGGNLEALDAAMARAVRMPPYPDADEALGILREAGLRVGVLTNSAREIAESALEAAGLELDLVAGADEAGAYKPDPRVYALGAERAGLPPGDICLVAAHAWDITGAAAAGMRTAWVARGEGELLDIVPAPDVRGADLAEVARELVRVR